MLRPSRLGIIGAVVVGASLSFFGVVARPVEKPRANLASGRPDPSQEKHYVTPRQLTESGAMSSVALALASATDHRGNIVHWSELAAERPLVVVFIKSGCPCNVEFEPFFHHLEEAYRDCVRVVGVIDADVAAANSYVEKNHVPYPVLTDPRHEIIDHFKAENGAYVALVTPDGVIDTLFPGCSVEMMRELSVRIARVTGISERAVDLNGLPNALTTGCPFRRST